jgi:4-alpha-glucanotransferase
MRLPRASGILLHPTSLPGAFGIGDIGPAASGWLDLLEETGQQWWQMLPVGPTGAGNSPYQAHSSQAGNPLLLSPEWLVEDGLLSAAEARTAAARSSHRVDFDAVARAKEDLLLAAFAGFGSGDGELVAFARDNAEWLDDYALYMALKEEQGGRIWYDWPAAIAQRDARALAACRERLAARVEYHQFLQFLFDRQWRRLRAACIERGVRLIGDLPIFAAEDSADVWARPELFELDANGRPTVVAGVPPDYFAADGQRWGNPLYRWDVHAAEHFAWWSARLKAAVDRFDVVRLDHFRGFVGYWEVPADAPTAASGRWALGPGSALLEALRGALGGLPLIAEDLGDITVEVEALRERFDLPGMKVLQFAFGAEAAGSQYLPYAYPNHCVVYTGTHDNDTTLGWLTSDESGVDSSAEQVEAQRRFIRRFAGLAETAPAREVVWGLIRAALASVADTAIFPFQDILGLGSEARMNVPGRIGGNWTWRFTHDQVATEALRRLADMTAVYGRWKSAPPAAPGASGSRPEASAV